jgi:N-acetylglucosaminyl-diphospho-decaprenol L-rhamnosyltransferase
VSSSATTTGPELISAVIPTYNSGELLDRCLGALANASVVDEVLVLDGGSSDGTPQRAAKWPGARVVEMPGTTISQRLNAGVRAARHDLVLFLNDDAFVDPETPASLAQVMLERPRVGVAGARLRFADGSQQRSAGHYKTLSGEILATLRLKRILDRFRRSSVRPVAGAPLEQATWLPLCAAVVRRKAFREVDGFDERFSFYSEDQDFARRLVGSGWQLVVHTHAGAVHIGGGSTSSKDPGPWLVRYYQNRTLYMRKHYPHGWRIYAGVWTVRATGHIAVWRLRALRCRLTGDPVGESAARNWASAYRHARQTPHVAGLA